MAQSVYVSYKTFSCIVFVLISTAIALTTIRKHRSKLSVQNWRGQMRSSEVSQCRPQCSEASQKRGKCGGTKLGRLRLQRLSYLLSHIALTLLLKSETVSNIEQHEWTKSYHQHITHTTSKAHSIPHTGRLGVNTFSDKHAFTCLNLHICKQARIQNNAWQKGRATTKWSRDTLLLRTDPNRNRELRKKRKEHQREKTPAKEVTRQWGLRSSRRHLKWFTSYKL